MSRKSRELDVARQKGNDLMRSWLGDWNKFAYEALDARLDREQRKIVDSVQHNPRTSVASGTARGKDFVTAVSAVCFMYMTPKFKGKELIENTKVALTAPTDRQVKNIMIPEIKRLWNRAIRKGIDLPGTTTAYDIRTDFDEWFLTGFKADEHNHEAWSGFHAVNTMFAITEASGISDDTFEAIEGNLQGNSRILLVFNPNTPVGYAAKSQKGNRFTKFRLNSMDAPNVVAKKIIIPGQVDYDWITDKIQNWCTQIAPDEFDEVQNDFVFEGITYRPTDLFRKKVLGCFPKVSEDVLIPEIWIERAEERWKEYVKVNGVTPPSGIPPRFGVDVAGMGRDNTVYVPRYNNFVPHIKKYNSGGKADHMSIAGEVSNFIKQNKKGMAFIDTIGEGAGVWSRLIELKHSEHVAVSVKYSEGAKDKKDNYLTDYTGAYNFANMRAYCFWAVRDWLDPKNETGAMLPPSETFKEEASEILWRFRSDGKVIIEEKEDIKKRIGRSPDEFDALANTFHPAQYKEPSRNSDFF